jgi:hypothetical protein
VRNDTGTRRLSSSNEAIVTRERVIETDVTVSNGIQLSLLHLLFEDNRRVAPLDPDRACIREKMLKDGKRAENRRR